LTRWVARTGTRDRVLVAIESGANLNFDRLRYISERTETGAHAEVLLAVRIPEEKGSFRRFCGALGNHAITEFNYRYSAESPTADIFVGLKVSAGDADRRALIASLQEQGYPITDLTDNELAKLHIRYMVGGRARVADEVLYRFEFPERPGALLRFLTQMGERWNISLFHYRNHGAADGRVLAGIQVAAAERPALAQFLADLGYPSHEETENPAYAFYLAG
jgi:threonine dehydratase